MKSKKTLFSSLKWIFEVSTRFSVSERKGRSSSAFVSVFLASLGIAFGVMTLICVVSVMNGFQSYSVNPVMEISSSHLRVSKIDEEKTNAFLDYCKKNNAISCVFLFRETQALMAGAKNRQSAVLVRAVEPNLYEKDSGFKNQLKIISGSFDLQNDELTSDKIILGKSLANQLGVKVGSTVNLMALAGGKDVSLVSPSRIFTVTGLYTCNYIDIEQSYCFVSLKSAQKYFGKDEKLVYGIKLKNYENDIPVVVQISENFPTLQVQSWRSFNRSFFGALRIEKNILMLLVCIIFLVVGINIYNGMRRLVTERREEISVLSALGGTKAEIKSIFIMRGFKIGFFGSISGLVLGLLLCINIKPLFEFLGFITGNYMFSIFAQVPAKIVFSEVFLITLFGIISPLWASYAASKNVLDMKIAEVLHNE